MLTLASVQTDDPDDSVGQPDRADEGRRLKVSVDGRFEVEIYLVNGKTVEYRVTEETAQWLAASGGWLWPAGISDDEKLPRAVFSTLANRMSKGTGFISATDGSARTWLIPTQAIVTFNVRDGKEPGAMRVVGFTPPTVETREP